MSARDPRKSGHMTSSIPRPRPAAVTRTPGGRISTTRVPSTRQAPSGRSTATRSHASTRPGSGRRDRSTPIPREKQLVKGRGKRLVVWGAALTFTAALIASLFVLPVKAYLRQDDALQRKQRELAVLDAQNAELQAEVDSLQTPEGIEQAAREEIGYVKAGEVRRTVLPAPDAPLALPTGWPYDAITQVIALRSQLGSQLGSQVGSQVATNP